MENQMEKLKKSCKKNSGKRMGPLAGKTPENAGLDAANILSAFSDRLQYLMEEHNLKQARLAEKLYISNSTLSGYLTGRRIPDTPMLIFLSNYFHTSTDFLLGQTPQLSRNNFSLSWNEDRLLHLLRMMDDRQQESLLDYGFFLLHTRKHANKP